jgi:hypothetical protein
VHGTVFDADAKDGIASLAVNKTAAQTLEGVAHFLAAAFGGPQRGSPVRLGDTSSSPDPLGVARASRMRCSSAQTRSVGMPLYFDWRSCDQK